MKTQIKHFLSLNLLLAFVIVFFSCNKKEDPDPCDSVICLNEGVCVSGVCDCKDGYTGPSCAEIIKPTEILIHQIDILKYPPNNNGEPWDLSSGPDLNLAIGYPVPWRLIHQQLTLFENASSDEVYSYIPPAHISLLHLDSLTTIELWDLEDQVTDPTLMGEIRFYPNSIYDGFPETYDLEDGDLAFRLHLEYVW